MWFLSAVMCLWPLLCCWHQLIHTLTLFQPSMEPICPIGLACASEISALLSPPSPLQVQVISSFIYSFMRYISQPSSFCSALDSGVLSQPFVFKRVHWYLSQTGWHLWKRFFLFFFSVIREACISIIFASKAIKFIYFLLSICFMSWSCMQVLR